MNAFGMNEEEKGSSYGYALIYFHNPKHTHVLMDENSAQRQLLQTDGVISS